MFNFHSFSISFPFCLLAILGVVERMSSWTHGGGRFFRCVLRATELNPGRNPSKGSTNTEANGGQMHVCRLLVDLALQCLSQRC